MLITRQEQVLEKEKEEEAQYAKYDDMGNRIDLTPVKVVPEAAKEEEADGVPKPLTLNLNSAQQVV